MGCPLLVCKLRMPQIIWYQTDITVVIRIILCDVKDYYLRVEYDHLRFSTILNEKDYYVCFSLFGAVLPEKTWHDNLGREIRIYLLKAHKWFPWLRLPKESRKDKLITVDPEHIYETDWSKSQAIFRGKESFTDYKRRNNIENILPVVPSSDEEDSDDERLPLTFTDI